MHFVFKEKIIRHKMKFRSYSGARYIDYLVDMLMSLKIICLKSLLIIYCIRGIAIITDEHFISNICSFLSGTH